MRNDMVGKATVVQYFSSEGHKLSRLYSAELLLFLNPNFAVIATSKIIAPVVNVYIYLIIEVDLPFR